MDESPTRTRGSKLGLTDGDKRWETPELAEPGRSLFLNGFLVSGTFNSIEMHEALVHPAMFAHPNPKHVAIVGGLRVGAVKEVLKHKTVQSAVLVQQDEELVQVCRQFFPKMSDCSDLEGRAPDCFEDEHVTVFYQDPKQYFAQDKANQFDVIIVNDKDPRHAPEIFSDEFYISNLVKSLSPEGVMMIYVGTAADIDDPRADKGVLFVREQLIRQLEANPEVEAMLVYEEARSGFFDPRSMLIICKSDKCRSRWYSRSDQVDFAIYNRIVKTQSEQRALMHYDGTTQFTYSLTPKAWETVYCRREPTPFECAYLHLDPARPLHDLYLEDANKSSFRVESKRTMSTRENGTEEEVVESRVYATVNIPEGSYIMPKHLASSLVLTQRNLEGLQSNLNVGAVLGSYLVFDEFHLFPHQAAATTLQLLRTVGKIAPFVLMTATFTQSMLQEIESLLGAKLIRPLDEEILQIETARGERSRKERLYCVVEHEINAQDVYTAHQQRSLAICNTVDRAITLYDGLLKQGCCPVPFINLISEDVYESLRKAKKPEERQAILQKIVSIFQDHLMAEPKDTWVMLLHSRFERPHRQVKEELLQTFWGKDGIKATLPVSLIVVATQVVEVGLDISAQTLHTELAPAANIFQRAGRCARIPGEQGTVYVYQVPLDKNGNPSYAPYGDTKLEKGVCKLTWDALQDRNNCPLYFQQEQEVINIAHTAADRHMLDEMKQDEGRIWTRIADALTQGDNSSRRELIRESVESRTLLVYEPPSGLSEESPYRRDGFSLHHGTLRGKLNEIRRLQDELGLKWALRYPYPLKDETDDSIPVAYRWLDVNLKDEKGAKKEIGVSLLFAIHPRLITYDAERGFCLAQASEEQYNSKLAVHYRERPDYGEYCLESYTQHITRMRQVFERGPWQRRLAWVSRRLAEKEGDWNIPAGLLERAVRLTFALHDLGKLDVRWQKWAAEYQESIGEGRPDFLIAHTHWDEDNPNHKEAQKKIKAKKPKTHSGEGADAGARVLWEAMNGKENSGLYKAAFTAIARHHSPFLKDANPYRLHAKVEPTLAETLAAVGERTWQDWA